MDLQRVEPRFTDLEGQLQELYCADNPALYEKCLIRQVGQIDLQLILGEKSNIDQIVAPLILKEMTQGTLIRKLCTYTAPNPTRRAIFEFGNQCARLIANAVIYYNSPILSHLLTKYEASSLEAHSA